MNVYKNRSEKPYSILVFDTTLISGNSLRFRQIILERILKLTISIDDKISWEMIR